jgi:mono/diheme cytochrome c family protein
VIGLSATTRAQRFRFRLAYRRRKADFNRARRAANVAAGVCLNETTPPTHGLRTHGQICARCHAVKKHGAAAVRSMEVEW